MRTRFRPNDDFMIIFTRRRKSDRTRTDDFFRFRQNMIARDFVSLGHAEDGRRVRGFPHVFSVGAGNECSFFCPILGHSIFIHAEENIPVRAIHEVDQPFSTG